MLGVDVAATIIIAVAISVLSSHYTIKTIVNHTSDAITKNMIALAYSQSKSSAENRKLELEDVREGFEFAEKLLGQKLS
jgi:hypothetical protein